MLWVKFPYCGYPVKHCYILQHRICVIAVLAFVGDKVSISKDTNTVVVISERFTNHGIVYHNNVYTHSAY